MSACMSACVPACLDAAAACAVQRQRWRSGCCALHTSPQRCARRSPACQHQQNQRAYRLAAAGGRSTLRAYVGGHHIKCRCGMWALLWLAPALSRCAPRSAPFHAQQHMRTARNMPTCLASTLSGSRMLLPGLFLACSANARWYHQRGILLQRSTEKAGAGEDVHACVAVHEGSQERACASCKFTALHRPPTC